MPAHSYRPFIGRPYAGRHGCFRLVEQIFSECYGWDISGLDADLYDVNARVARLHDCLTRYAVPVDEPREGDVVLIRSAPWHVGVVIEPPEMIHSYLGGSAVVVRYDTVNWGNRIAGFYRYTGPVSNGG